MTETNSFLVAIIQSSDDAILGMDVEGVIKIWNKGAEVMFGYSEKEIVGQSIIVLYPQELLPEHADILSKTKKGEHIEHYETQRKKKDGTIIDVSLSVSPIKDETGELMGFSKIIRDISIKTTESKQALFYARSVIEAGLDPMITISPEGKITDVNGAMMRVTGLSREQLIGSDFINYFPDAEEARQGYEQVFREGFVREYPLIIKSVTGILTDVLYNASVYKDDKGKIFGAIAALRDIGAQKKLDEKLHETSAYARSLIEASLDPLFIISSEGKITGVNRATETVTGVTREWLIDTDFSTYFTEPHKAQAGYRQVLKEGLVRDFPLSIHDAAGKITDVSFNASVYKDAAGLVRGIFAVARDVTETKKISHYARSLIEVSQDPLVTISPEGKITDANKAAIQVTNVDRGVLIGSDFSTYFTDPQKAHDAYEQAFKTGFITDYPLTVKSKDGKLTDVLYNASVYKDEKGNILGVTATARDYTRAKKAVEVASLANKELESFSSSVSHDLRAPLRSIDGFSKILVDDYAPKLGEDGKVIIASIRQSAQLMGKLIEDLLSFSKVGSGDVVMSDVEMTKMTKSIFLELKNANPSRSIILNVPEMPKAHVDPALMKQVWTNLLSNAVKYTNTQKEAVIDITFKVGNEETVYAVKDNGVGFDMKDAPKLFEAFHRLHSQEEFEGTGIGLVTVKRIVEKHGGRVWAEGKINSGATFYFSLPLIKKI